jgi:hypothetical protein
MTATIFSHPDLAPSTAEANMFAGTASLFIHCFLCELAHTSGPFFGCKYCCWNGTHALLDREAFLRKHIATKAYLSIDRPELMAKEALCDQTWPA